MKLTPAGKKLIQEFEGLSLVAYKCPAGKLTIGYGHTGADVTKDLVITATKAGEILEADIARFAFKIRPLIKYPINDNQFSALLSFAYNLGAGALAGSTLLKKLNSGDVKGAATEFGRWVFCGKDKLPGLVRRRAAEKALFISLEKSGA